jgi:TolB protein
MALRLVCPQGRRWATTSATLSEFAVGIESQLRFVMKRPLLSIALVSLVAVAACFSPARTGSTPAAKQLTRNRDFLQHLSWSPDGGRLLFTRIHGGHMALWTMKADGSDWKQVFASNKQPHFDGCWHPDNRKIAFVFDKLQGTDGLLQIDTINLDGSDHKNLIPHKAFEESPRWSPDGKRLAWVSTRDGNQEIYVADADGKNLKRLTSEPAQDNNPSWSPDGKQIAFCSGRKGNLDIWVMNADGSDVHRLTTDPHLDCWPAWSPDGKRIAFTTNRDGNYEVYVMNADGTGQRNVTRHPAQDNFPAWSPDGKRLAFISNRGGGYNVYVMEVE